MIEIILAILTVLIPIIAALQGFLEGLLPAAGA